MRAEEVEQTLELRRALATLYADTRFTPTRHRGDLRTLLVTVMWVIYAEPHVPGGERWARTCEILGLDGWKFWGLISEDAPRYVPIEPRRGCNATMIRKAGLCGKPGSHSFREINPVDGTFRLVDYCRRHIEVGLEHEARENAQRGAGAIPEPMPNTGGLLPCYLDWAWPEMYLRARPWWKPPAAGLCADDWPTMAKVLEKQPPKLQLLTGAGEQTQDGLPLPSGDSSPVLTLIRSRGPAPTPGHHKEGTP